MGKKELRKGMLISLEEVDGMERRRIEKAMHTQLFDSPMWKEAKRIGVTVSGEKEWDTHSIIKRAWKEDKQVFVPKSIHSSRELHFYHLTSFDQLETGYFNLQEPLTDQTERVNAEEIDLLIVPGLLFTLSGYRIGFGGGFFDRFLVDFPNTTLSLVHTNQLVESFPIEAHDVPVDYIVTENEWLETGLNKEMRE
ncbi:5-formyltetrahydrofolate cyclo-ligase [Alkalibacterium sp. MB6]|uniref:5-formyltetrahydrofolate cyclo-ligase n=1 Tax=Alkalibacterium sp. MB6 TaxID=2081965 RepID=UPI00137971EC|nr:5-formyltetrahydrofolate cyclo-ligase [Alkalibacterium sp. MB6]